MSAARVGSLCSGYGGLEMGLLTAVPGSVAWHAEYDAAPSKILAHHWPDVPNLRDITTVDWTAVEPVDVLTAGYPCQPFSHAGKRKGKDDERHLWPFVARAIGALRPGLVFLENVRGHVSLGLADVLADLSGLGYDAQWGVVRAADAGAPHSRARVFIVATDRKSDGRHEWRAEPAGVIARPDAAVSGDVAAADASRERHGRGQDAGSLGRLDRPDAGEARQRQRARQEPVDRGSAAAADADDGRRGEHHPQLRGVPVADAGCDDPTAADTEHAERSRERAAAGPPSGHDRSTGTDWGGYTPAIRRWEYVTGRPAPRPTEPGRNGERLSPAFVEWMMGLPAGHVTDAPGLTRNAQLKALGNGVVPQQAALALRLLSASGQAVAA